MNKGRNSQAEWDCGHHQSRTKIACFMVYTSTDSKDTLLANIARNKMHKGVVRIKFVKADGTIRTAIATTSDGVVRSLTKSHKYWYDGNHTPFFDLNLGRWRSFCNDRLRSVETLSDYRDED